MDYHVKHLSADETAILRQLLKVFESAFEDADAYGSAVPDNAYLRSLLSKPHFIALVALQRGIVVGGLAAYELEKFEQKRSEIYIYDLAVTEAFRRRGIATALITELKSIARTRGAYLLFVQADLVDAPAINLYESFGTREEVLHFDLPV